MEDAITLELIRQAARRIKGHVRRTPLIPAAPASDFPNLWFKPECLQVSGSFKARGAFNSALSLDHAAAKRGLTTASGGNFGAAIAHVGQQLGLPAHVVVMEQSTQTVRDRIEGFGAVLDVTGFHWDESWDHASRLAEERGLTLLHPFATPEVIAGQGTIGLEIMEDLADVGTVFVAIGGGGLIGGIAAAIKLQNRHVRVIGVETVGCPTLHAAVKAGRPVKLDRIDTKVPILGARMTYDINLALVRKHVDQIVLVDEDRPKDVARWMWKNTGLAVELGAATVVSAVFDRLVDLDPQEKLVAVLCGSGDDGLT
ncbi:MAG: pyridoxal-phosphate dependent enzyme [Alphaproteobacteria bacterium]|nr:pyridoxal-phosphate dependent enzyme [Alphaproteobacteria bacterium]